ncbi:MAG: class I SAM-dependent RNA methyltransferase [Alphaproteobacteria bacterium]|nr:class I SAM-dependent RNA methyltransferase [Alphaproteobacteria bacterium]
MNSASSALCPHFGVCGGCLWQDLEAPAYLARKRDLITDALHHHGIDGEVAEVYPVAPCSRRRARLKAERRDGGIVIGFHARSSHALVDMTTCKVLTPGLLACVSGVRQRLGALLRNGDTLELYLGESESGIDLAFSGRLGGKTRATLAIIAEFARWAEPLGLSRVTLNGHLALLLSPPRIALGKASVELPPGGFLQPTRAGEARLQSLVAKALGKAKSVADLFAGCGTFTFIAAERAAVHAVESDPRALQALATAARHASGLKPVSTELRDLARLPLGPMELKRFDAIILDPPRAGALAQSEALAASAVSRIVYVSCNPSSFARDARRLMAKGFAMDVIQPVDQFLWSDHIELVTVFTRR